MIVLEESGVWCLPGVLQLCSPTVGLCMARLEYVGVGVMMPPVIVSGVDLGPVPLGFRNLYSHIIEPQ